MRLQLALVLCQLTLAAALSGSLYTYANYNNTPGLYVIDPATGASFYWVLFVLTPSRTSTPAM